MLRAYGSGTDADAVRARQELMRTLTIRISSRMLRMRISFPVFQMFILYTLSISVKIPNLKRSFQNMLSMHIRN